MRNYWLICTMHCAYMHGSEGGLNKDLVGPVGFEPTTYGLRGHKNEKATINTSGMEPTIDK